MNALAVLIALAAATCFALASALQHREARQESAHWAMDPRLLLRLLRRRLWLAGGAAALAGTALQAAALGTGALAVVSPVLVSGLFLSIPLEAVLNRQRLRGRDLIAVALATVGLAIFLGVANPSGGVPAPSTAAWAWVGLTVGPVIAACLFLARYSTSSLRATYLGLATGVLYGVSSALLKVCAEQLAVQPLALLGDWRLYALIAVGGIGLVVNQNAFQGSPLAAPLTALTLAEPIVGVAIGVTAFHEQLSGGGIRALALIIAAILIAYGVCLTSTAQQLSTADRAEL